MRIRCALFVMVGLTLAVAAATAVSAQEIAVAEAVICREVVDRTPLGVGDVIASGVERVFCFTRIEGAQEETEITHNWYYQGALKASVTLPVRSGSWRTWSSKALLPEWTGEWMVEVLAKDGTPLYSLMFVVQ